MKKNFFGILLLVSCLLFAHVRSVEATDVYVGRYPSGLDAYVILSTLIFDSAEYVDFKTTVKATDYGSQTYYIDYHFWRDRGTVYFSNSQGFHGIVDKLNKIAEDKFVWSRMRKSA